MDAPIISKMTAAAALGINVDELLTAAIVDILSSGTIIETLGNIQRKGPPTREESPKHKATGKKRGRPVGVKDGEGKKHKKYKKRIRDNTVYYCKWCQRGLSKHGLAPHQSWCSENPDRRKSHHPKALPTEKSETND